jgi:predicted transcriptional regulator
VIILADRLKNRARISSSVDPELWDKMQKISDETDIPLSKLLDRAMKEFVEHYEQKEDNK